MLQNAPVAAVAPMAAAPSGGYGGGDYGEQEQYGAGGPVRSGGRGGGWGGRSGGGYRGGRGGGSRYQPY